MDWKWNGIEGSQKGIAVFCGPRETVHVTMQSFSEANLLAKLIDDKVAEAIARERTLAANRARDAVLSGDV